MKKSAVVAALWCALLTAVPPPLYPQENSDFSHSFDERLLSVYLDRADEEKTREEWEIVSRHGIDAVTGEWERRFLLLIDDPGEFERQLELVRRNLEEQARDRCAEWLIGGYLASIEDDSLFSLLAHARENGLSYIYLTDGQGRIVYDDAGDPIVRGTRDGDDDTYAADRAAWRASMEAHASELLASWEASATGGFDELLSTVSPEQRARIESGWQRSFNAARSSRRRELDKIFLLEQTAFDRLRLQDQYSLRLQTEEQTARATAQALIERMQSDLDGGLEALLRSLDTEAGEVNVDGEVVDGDEWQESFRKELEKGLALWDEAEEEFFLRRIEWERQAGYDLAEGQRAWMEAFELLQAKRSVWLSGFRRTLDEGRDEWANRSEELDRTIENAIAELDANIGTQRSSLAGRMENLIDMLDQSMRMMSSARGNWEYWLGSGGGVSMDIWSMREHYVNEFARLQSGSGGLAAGSIAGLQKSVSDTAKSISSLASQNGYVALSSIFGADLAPVTDVTYQLFTPIYSLDSQSFASHLISGDGFGEKSEYLPGLNGAERALLDALYGYRDEARLLQQRIDGLRKAGELLDDFLLSVCLDPLREETGDAIPPSAGWFFDSLVEGWSGKVDQFVTERESEFGSVIARQEALDYFFRMDDLFRDWHGNGGPEQACFWMEEIYATYQRFAEQAHEELLSTYGIVVWGDPGTHDLADEEGIYGPISALEDGSWERFFLDNYQVEILKARAIRDYWRKEYEVAQAVYNYSVDGSSNRPTEAETEAEYERTLGNYEEALAAYNEAVDRLEAINIDIAENQEQLASLMQELGVLKAELEEAEATYREYFTAYQLASPEFQQQEFRRAYERLLDLHGLSPTEADNEESSLAVRMAAYYSAARKYGVESDLSMVSEHLRALVAGEHLYDEGIETPALSALRAVFADRSGWSASGDALGSYDLFNASLGGGGLHLSSSDPVRDRLQNLYLDRAGIGGSIAELGKDERNLFLLDAQAIVRPLIEMARVEIENRIDAIRLLATDSFSAWLEPLGGTEYHDVPMDEVIEGLERKRDTAEKEALVDRLRIEIAALESLADLIEENREDGVLDEGFEPDGPASWDLSAGCAANEALAAQVLGYLFWNGFPAETTAAERAGELGRFLQRLDRIRSLVEGLDGTLQENADLLREAISGNEYLKLYLEGGSLLMRDGLDYAAPFLPEGSVHAARLDNAARLLSEYREQAPVLRSVMREAHIGAVFNWLTGNRLAVEQEDGSLRFTGAEDLWDRQGFGSYAEMREYLTALDTGIMEIVSTENLPSYLVEAVGRWQEHLSRFFFLQAIEAGWSDLPDPGSNQALAEGKSPQAEAFAGMISEKIGTLDRVSAGSDGAVVRSALLLSLIEPTDPSYGTAEEIFLETAGLSLAALAAAQGEVDPEEPGTADRLFQDFLASSSVEEAEPYAALIMEHRSAILQRAAALLAEAAALADLGSVDWETADEGLVRTALASRLNGLPLEEYALLVRHGMDFPSVEALFQFHSELASMDGGVIWNGGPASDLLSAWTNAHDGILDESILDAFARYVQESLWIEPQEGEDLRAADVLQALEEQWTRELVVWGDAGEAFSGFPGDALFANAFFASASLVLPEETVRWFMQAAGYGGALTLDAEEYRAAGDETRVRMLHEGDDRAFLHYLERLALGGIAAGELLGLCSGRPGVRAELERFLSRLEAAGGYIAGVDGDLLAYLGERGCLTGGSAAESVPYLVALAGGAWDDPFFTLAQTRAADELEGGGPTREAVLRSWKTRSEVFVLPALLAAIETQVHREITELQNEHQLLVSRFCLDLTFVDVNEAYEEKENYRRFLQGKDYLLEAGTDWDDEDREFDYEEPLTVGILIRDAEAGTLVRSDDNLLNWRLDAYNDIVTSQRYLSDALVIYAGESAYESAAGSLDSFFGRYAEYAALGEAESVSSLDLTRPFESIEVGLELSDEYEEAAVAAQNCRAEIASIRARLAEYGAVIGDFVEQNDIEEITRPTRDMIAGIKSRIAAREQEWRDLLNASGGYRVLEQEYEEQYGMVRTLLAEVNRTKQEHRIAKGIYEYARSGYLANQDSSGAVTASEGLEEEIAALETSLEAVDPDSRLLAVADRLHNAQAAVEAVEAIYRDPATQKRLQELDAVYRSYREQSEEYERSLLVLTKLESVLVSVVQRQTRAVNDARDAYEEALFTFSGYRTDEDERADWIEEIVGKIADPAGTNERFTRLIGGIGIDYADGSACITFQASGGLSGTRRESLERYFGLSEEEYENADYIKDLLQFSEKLRSGAISEGLLKRWTYAIAFEEIGIRTNRAGLYLQRETMGDDGCTKLVSYINPKAVDAMEDVLQGAYDHGSDDIVKKINEADVWEDLQKAYNAVDQSSVDFNLFKLAYLLDLWDGKCAESFGENALNHLTFESSAHKLKKKYRSISSIFRRRYWRKQRDEARKHRDGAKRNYDTAWSSIDATGTKVDMDLAALRAAEARLALLNGDPAQTGGDAAVSNLKLAILDAFAGDRYEHLDQVLSMAGIEPESSDAVFDSLLNPLRVDGGSFGATAENSLLLLQKIIQRTAAQKEAIERRFSEYLTESEAEGEAGIATLQQERMETLARANERFLADGALAPEGFDLEAHRARIPELDGSEPGDSRILGAIEAYLDDSCQTGGDNSAGLLEVPEGYGQNRFERALSDALAAYRTESLAEKQRQKWNELTASWAELLEACRIGADYLAAAQEALGNPVFSRREHLLRNFEQTADLLGEMADSYDSYAFPGLAQSIAGLSEALLAVADARNDAYRELRVTELGLLRTEFAEQRDVWEQQMGAILSRGQMEWKRANLRVKAQQEQWQKRFSERFREKAAAWDAQYLGFTAAKQQWMAGITEEATQIGVKRILEQFGTDTRDAIAHAAVFVIPDVAEPPDVQAVLAEAADETLLSQLLGGAGRLTGGIGTFRPVVFTALAQRSYRSADTLDAVRSFQTRNNDELASRLAVLQYEQALDSLQEARERFGEQVEEANENFDEGMRRMFLSDGFHQEGRNYVKETFVGSTLWAVLTEEHAIEGYRPYEPHLAGAETLMPDMETGVLEQMGFTGVQALLARAMGGLEKEQQRVFGSPEEARHFTERYDGNRIISRDVIHTETMSEEEFEEYLQILAENFEDSDDRRLVSLSPGEFGAHIGYAPKLKAKPDPERELDQWRKNVRFPGSGEQGRMIGLYMQHKLIEGKGFAEANSPWYNQKLWDDRGMWMDAPSMRTVVDIGVTAVVAASTGGAGLGPLLLSTGLNLADDALFTMADIGNGMDAGDAWGGFGKKALTSGATSAIGAGFNGTLQPVSGSSQLQMQGGLADALGVRESLLGSTLLKGTEIATTTIASSALEAMDFSRWGKSGFFDPDAFYAGAFGKEAIAGVAAGMTGQFVTGGLGKWNLEDSNQVALSSRVFDTRVIGAFNSLAGGLVSSAVEYGISGSTTLNVLNSRDLGFGGTGLLEWRLGRERKAFGLGMGGTDVSAGTLAASLSGLRETALVGSFKRAGIEGKSTLAAMNMLGYTSQERNWAQAQGMLEGKLCLQWGSGDEEGGASYRGYYDGGNTITVSRALSGGGIEGAAQLAAVFSHEGTHLTGNRVEALAHLSAGATYRELAAVFAGQVGDEGFAGQIAAAMLDPESWTENTEGDRQYWELRQRNGEWGWAEDRSLDFDVSALGNDPKALALLAMQNPALAKALLDSAMQDGQEFGTISAGRMNQGVAAEMGTRLMPVASWGERNLGGLVSYDPQRQSYDRRRTGFIEGTMVFAGVSASASALMMQLQNEGAHRQEQIQSALGSLNSALYAVQGSGLLIEHGVDIDTSGLVGEGTDAIPYLSTRALANGSVTVTGWPGYRYVNEEFYYGLQNSMVKTKERTQGWLDANYALRGFAKAVHSGGDLVGSGDVVSQVAGTLTMGYDRTFGLSGFTASGVNPGLGYFSGHLDAQSVMDYISLMATQGTTLNHSGGSYNLSGVIAGMVIGQQGQSGIATGDHVHNEIRVLQQSGAWLASAFEWNRTFRTSQTYSDALNPTTWAARNTGYSNDDPSNPQLWQNIYDDWRQYGYGYSNFPAFQFDNLQIAPALFGLN